MADKNYFFTLFLLTIFIVRIFLFVLPTASPTLRGFRLHHYMYGLIMALVGALLESVTLYAIGTGLFIDELGYLLIGGKTHDDNYSHSSLLLTAVFVILVYLLRDPFLFWK